MNKVTSRQAGIIMAISILSLKFITYPALFSKYSGIDGYLAVSFVLAIDLLIIGVILHISKVNRNKNYVQIFKGLIGENLTRVISFTLFIYFLVKVIFLIKEHHNYMLDTLFTFIPWQYFAVPLLFFVAFLMNKTLRAVGRSAEVFFPLIILALGMTLLVPISEIDYTNLLPILADGIEPVLQAVQYCVFSSADYFVLIMLLGNIKLEKNTNKTIFRYCLASSLFVVFFYVVFFSLFGLTNVTQIIAIGDMPLFATFPNTVGRIDWITINLWTIALTFQSGVLLSFALHCFNHAFNLKSKTFGTMFILGIIFFMTYVLFLNLSVAIKIVSSDLFVFIVMVYQILIPTIMFVASIKNVYKRRSKFGFSKKVFTE